MRTHSPPGGIRYHATSEVASNGNRVHRSKDVGSTQVGTVGGAPPNTRFFWGLGEIEGGNWIKVHPSYGRRAAGELQFPRL